MDLFQIACYVCRRFRRNTSSLMANRFCIRRIFASMSFYSNRIFADLMNVPKSINGIISRYSLRKTLRRFFFVICRRFRAFTFRTACNAKARVSGLFISITRVLRIFLCPCSAFFVRRTRRRFLNFYDT